VHHVQAGRDVVDEGADRCAEVGELDQPGTEQQLGSAAGLRPVHRDGGEVAVARHGDVLHSA
jgi:hypothetical protein